MHRFGQRVYIEILEHLVIVLTTGNRWLWLYNYFLSVARLYDNCQRGLLVYGDNRTIIINYVFINWEVRIWQNMHIEIKIEKI